MGLPSTYPTVLAHHTSTSIVIDEGDRPVTRQVLPTQDAGLRLPEFDARRTLLPLAVEDEGLHGHPVDHRVDAAVKGADGATGDLLDGLAELADRCVLE